MLFYVICDYENPDPDDYDESFSIIDMKDQEDTDYTFLIGIDKRFYSFEGVGFDVAEKLGIAVDEVKIEEV